MNNHSEAKNFDIFITFDNQCVEEGFKKGFGFSALVHNHFSDNFILFDTGGNGNILVHNLRQFDIDISRIKKVIISHNHHDHAGGLDKIYQMAPNKEIYISKSKSSYERNFPKAKIFVNENVKEIDQNMYTSGTLGSLLKEQALFCEKSDNKIIVLVGCTHPGLENFIQKAKELGEVEVVIGGFHGFRKFSYLKGIDFIGACHCTQHKSKIAERFPEQYKKICVGNRFSF
ncbi:MAG: MBL fold metallo-hydrolase [Promethearchaeia archaeon]